MERFEDREPGRQPDGEGRKDDVERDGKGELNPRQEKSSGIHCNLVHLRPQLRAGDIGPFAAAAKMSTTAPPASRAIRSSLTRPTARPS